MLEYLNVCSGMVDRLSQIDCNLVGDVVGVGETNLDGYELREHTQRDGYQWYAHNRPTDVNLVYNGGGNGSKSGVGVWLADKLNDTVSYVKPASYLVSHCKRVCHSCMYGVCTGQQQ